MTGVGARSLSAAGIERVSRTDKLYVKLLEGRLKRFSDLERLLRAFGFELDRVAGSHHIYVHANSGSMISLQPKGGEVKPYQLRQARDMIRDLGLSLDDRDDG